MSKVKNTHGGPRANAGRPPTLIDEKRVMTLTKLGYSQRVIAERMGVSKIVIQRVQGTRKKTS